MTTLAKAAGLFKGIAKEAVDILFPPKCVGCSKEGDFLCSVCERSLARLEDPYCPTCAQPMRSEATCQRCQESPLDIDGIRSPFLMEGVIRIMIHRMKYNDFRALATVLGRLLSSSMDAYLIPADFLMAVPLHPRRERRRGYNQSLLLAREVSMSKGIPLAKGLVRVKDAPPQARAADAESRRANVKDAFAFRGTGLDGRRVLLIDDVCTTGATLGACALALKNSGAAAVWGLTLAREA